MHDQADVDVCCFGLTSILVEDQTRHPSNGLTDFHSALSVIHGHDLWTTQDLQTLSVLQGAKQQIDRVAGCTEYESTVAQSAVASANTKGRDALCGKSASAYEVFIGQTHLVEIESRVRA